jgi:trans-aconitate methyltransferase
MGHQAKNNEVYNRHAHAFKTTFDNNGARTYDIELAIRLAGNPPAAHVVEIGCGTGRDAAEIIKRVAWYEGFDPAENMVNVAQTHVPQARFVVADAVSYAYPPNLDVVFAFASLLHVDHKDMPMVFQKVAQALRPGGIFCVRLREKDEYSEEIQTDEFGDRLYFHYNPKLLQEYAGNRFSIMHVDRDIDAKRDITWFGVAFKKN